MSNLTTVHIVRSGGPDDDLPWRVWIPPTDPEHWEGEDILAPYGDTYWPTWPAAINFVAYVLSDGRLGSIWVPPPRTEETMP